jgi:hypothetical protein
VASVEYSLRDLDYAGKKLGWLTASGMALVQQLKQELAKVKHRIAPYEATVLRSRYGPDLKGHRQELTVARETYGPVRE